MGFESGHLVRVVLHAVRTDASEEQVNVLHYDIDNSSDPDPSHNISLQSLADRIRDDVIGPFAALYGSNWNINPVVVEEEKDPLAPTTARSSATSGTPVAGTRVGSDDLPKSLCCVVTLRTARIGRRFTGRMFVGGRNSDPDLAGDNWSTNKLDGVNAFVAAIPHQPDLITGVTTNTASWCVYSRTQRAANLDPYAEHVVSTTVRTKAHWLRSRES